MADIDLLVRDAEVREATKLLEDCGFAMTFNTWRHQLFESRDKGAASADVLGEHVDNPLKIELHTRICERLPVNEVDITSFVFPADPRAGLNDYPSSASLMMHLLLHAAGNMRAHALRLIQLCDIVRLAERFRPNDWADLLDARSNGRDLWWAMPPLALTARYHPGAIPPSVLEQLSARCSWLLRRLSRRQRLSEVSWSNIRIYALPGLEWCSSPQEAVRFVISRAWPSRQTRTELRRFAAHQVGAGEIPWYGLSQGRRILRWAFSNPPRVQALLPIRAALAASDKQANTAELSSAAVTPRS
jgi:hypothetical protein